MDIFRLSSSDANNDSFTSARRIMSKGGDQALFGNRMSTFATVSLALSTGDQTRLQAMATVDSQAIGKMIRCRHFNLI